MKLIANPSHRRQVVFMTKVRRFFGVKRSAKNKKQSNRFSPRFQIYMQGFNGPKRYLNSQYQP